MSRTVLIWTAFTAIGLMLAIAQKMVFHMSPEVGLATIALFTVGAIPLASRLATVLGTGRPRRSRSVRLIAI